MFVYLSTDISPTNKIQPVYSFPGSLSHARQRQVTVWKTASSHQGTVNRCHESQVLDINRHRHEYRHCKKKKVRWKYLKYSTKSFLLWETFLTLNLRVGTVAQYNSRVPFSAQVIVCVTYLPCICVAFSVFSCFLPPSPKHVGRQIGDSQLALVVNVCKGACSGLPMIDWNPIQDVFPPPVQCSLDRPRFKAPNLKQEVKGPDLFAVVTQIRALYSDGEQ